MYKTISFVVVKLLNARSNWNQTRKVKKLQNCVNTTFLIQLPPPFDENVSSWTAWLTEILSLYLTVKFNISKPLKLESNYRNI